MYSKCHEDIRVSAIGLVWNRQHQMSSQANVRAQSAAKPTFTPMGSGLLQRQCACGKHTPAGGECEECRKNRLQRKTRNSELGTRNNSSVPPIVHDVLRSPGQSLDSTTRAFMEPRFRHNFTDVRVHTDECAAESARAVNALAYTVGRDVVFGSGQYAPRTPGGLNLLAHELAHVVQQRYACGAVAELEVEGARSEGEADAAAAAVLCGRNAPVAMQTARPVVARFSESKKITEPDGAEVEVSRIITPAKCISKPESRTETSGDITAQQAFLQFDFCRGRVGTTVRGELNYGDAIDKARTAAQNFASNLSTQSPDQAARTFENDLKQVAPQGEVRVNFQAPGVRITLGGTGEASVAKGATGEAKVRGEVDVGPVTIGVEAKERGGTQEPRSEEVLVTVGTRRSPPDRNCFICVCSDPNIVFQCMRKEPPSVPPPAKPGPQPVIVPLFFEFEKTEPRADWKGEYEKMLRLAVDRVREGNTIARIEGNASPEGPERPKRRGGFNNVDLAQARAEKTQKDLQDALKRAFTISMRDAERLRAALAATYSVEGKGELFGVTENREVAERDLFRHLQTTLRAPAEGEADKLAAAHLTGAGLPAEVEAEVEEQVGEFRTGRRGEKKLSRSERLEAIYRPLRRALIFLDPPPPPKPPVLVGKELSEEVKAQIIGKPIECTDAHKKLFAGSLPPKEEMFTGNCNEPGKRTTDLGKP